MAGSAIYFMFFLNEWDDRGVVKVVNFGQTWVVGLLTDKEAHHRLTASG